MEKQAGRRIARIAQRHTQPILTPRRLQNLSKTVGGKLVLGALGTFVLVMLATPTDEASLPPHRPPSKDD